MRLRVNDVLMWGGLLGIAAGIAVFMVPIPTTDVGRIHHSEDRVAVSNVVMAVENFRSEFDRMPDPGRRWLEMDGQAGALLLRILMGEDRKQNSRQINFLSVREGKGKLGGIFYSESDDLPAGLYDAYGRPFRIALNLKGEDPFLVRYNGRDVAMPGEVVAVWSVGKDGVEGTRDDVTSWKR